MEKKERYTELAHNIRQYRIRNNMTQGQLAAKIGVTSNTIHAWEKGLRRPSVGPLSMLADLLDISLAEAMAQAERVSKVRILIG